MNPKFFTTMRLCLMVLLSSIVFNQTVFAQLGGVKTINSAGGADYVSIAAAVTDLNTLLVASGGVTFNVAADHVETLTAPIVLTATGSITNPIIFQKSGVGSNPLIKAYTGTKQAGGVEVDGMWALSGCDYVTIDGIDLLDDTTVNTTPTACMEYGYALFKASATDGCQNNTIKNCYVKLYRTNTSWAYSGVMVSGSIGILVPNALLASANAPTLVITVPEGSNSYNKMYGNTIDRCNMGMVFYGASAFIDTANEIGGASALEGNSIINFGGMAAASGPATGIYLFHQLGVTISNNTINNNNGKGINHPHNLRGIWFPQSTLGAILNCSYNTITLKGGSAAAGHNVSGFEIASGTATSVINIHNNILKNFQYSTASTGITNGILTSANANFNIYDNLIDSFNHGSTTTSSDMNGINSGGSSSVLNIHDNTITNFTRFGTGPTASGITVTNGSATIKQNTIGNIVSTGTAAGGATYGMSLTTTGFVVCDNNTISGIRNTRASGNGVVYGINRTASAAGTNTDTIRNCTISDIGYQSSATSTAAVVCGIFSTGIAVRVIHNNTISKVVGNVNVMGISVANALPIVFNNKIYGDTTKSATTGINYGIMVSNVPTNANPALVYNNVIGGLYAPNASNTTESVIGVSLGAATNVSYGLYHNTIYLDGTSAGANFSSAGVSHTLNSTAANGALNISNNIIVNSIVQKGTGVTVAFKRTSATDLNNVSTVANNIFSVGASPSNYLFSDGTNKDSVLTDFQTRFVGKENASIIENVQFAATDGLSSSFLMVANTYSSLSISGGVSVALVTTDITGAFRNSPPYIGAYESTGNPVPVTLIYFVATRAAEKNSVQLKWSTASEINNKGFEIERSVDGQNFEKINFVKGTGTTNKQTTYNYLDELTSSTIYYRLKQIDFNGEYTYSKTVKIGTGASLINDVVVSPNPYLTNYNIVVNANIIGAATVEMIDMQGRAVATQQINMNAGENTIEIQNAAMLNAGVYILRITLNNETQTIKLVKQ